MAEKILGTGESVLINGRVSLVRCGQHQDGDAAPTPVAVLDVAPNPNVEMALAAAKELEDAASEEVTNGVVACTPEMLSGVASFIRKLVQ